MRSLPILVSCLTIGLASFAACAQDGPPGGPPRREGGRQGMGQPLSPEKAKAAWEVQAKGVAADLALSPEQTKALTDAYAAARTSQGEAADKMRKDMMEKAQEEGAQTAFAEIQKKTEELVKSEQAKFSKALSATLNPAQVSKAMESLGEFGAARQWDVLTDVITGFGLDSAKTAAANKTLREYVIAVGKARGGEDREAARTAMGEARKTMTDSMKGMLTEDQFAKFQASMGGGRGGQGGPGGRRPPADAPTKDGDK